MKLSLPERLYVNGLIRNLVQRPLEFRAFNRIAPFPRHAHVLEIGCGNGGGLSFIARHYQPASLTGLDLDPRQIAAAKHRLTTSTKPHKTPLNLMVGSATAINLPAHSFDAILCIGVLHHIPEWRRTVAECARLLRHGGLLYSEEFYPPLLTLPVIRQLAPHPATDLSPEALTETLTQYGFQQLGIRPSPSNRLTRWLGRYTNLSVHRLAITQAEYD